MAVTQISDGASIQRVDSGGIEPSCEKAVGGPRRSSIKGTSTRNQDKGRGRVKIYELSKKRKKDNQDSLSDIDDSEVAEYLHTKEEFNIKSFIWEAMNKRYSEAKKQKRTTETKKCAPVKKVVKTTGNAEVQKPSSKVNYDALKLLEDEFSW